MAEIYYCRNEDDLKRVCLYIFHDELNNSCAENAIELSGIRCCDYRNNDEEECYIDSCQQCLYDYDDDICLLADHLEDKDARKHILLKHEDIEYPCIVAVTDAYYKDERMLICPISDAKANTKYGYENWW